jgi:hypothetical protein
MTPENRPGRPALTRNIRFGPKQTLICFWLKADLVRSRPSKSGGWNHYLQRKLPQRSRQQLRPQPPPQPGPAPQAPHPGPPHPGPQPPPPRQRKLPQRSRQQRRPHCTSVILSMSAVAAAGSGRIGAAWVVPEPPATTRPAIPIANSMRNMCPPDFSMVHPLVVDVTRKTSD